MDPLDPGGPSSHLTTTSTTTDSPLALSLEKLSLSGDTHNEHHTYAPATQRTYQPLDTGRAHLDFSKPATIDPRADSLDYSFPQGAGRPPSRSPYPHATQESAAPPPASTAADIASTFLSRDLACHGSHATASADTVIVLQDECYGHRFSRPRTTKTSLSMIVERPERLRAVVLGVSAAYVRLGARDGPNMRAAALGPVDALSRPPFRIHRTPRRINLLDPAIVAIHGKQWLSELQQMCNAAGEKLAIDGKELDRGATVTNDGRQTSKPKLHEGDLYLCAKSLAAFEGALGGVCEGVDAVFDPSVSTRRAFVAIRPPGHHCAADFPSGFCWLNNVHVGIEYAAQRHGLTHAAILDFDLHHGDGSQDITWTRNARIQNMPKNTPQSKKVMIGYYSMHDINSYPCETGDTGKVQSASLCIDNAHGQSIWNVHLEPYSSPAEFWALYEQKYSVLLVKARSFLRSHAARIKASPKGANPKAAIFISAGFDASQWEGAGMQRHAVNVPTDFYARFTADVVKIANEEGTACEGRVISVLEGGYSDRALTSGVLSHVSGLCHTSRSNVANGQGHAGTSNTATCNPEWWSAENLNALEAYISPPAPPLPRKNKGGLVSSYSSPTASFSNKVVDPNKFAKSASETMRQAPEPFADASTVPREIGWIVATHELSKLLIPSDRTIGSCTAESLAVPKVKKEVPPMDSLSLQDSPSNVGRQLRERKAKASDITGSTTAKTPVASPRKVPQRVKKPRGPIAVPSVAAHSVPIVAPSPAATAASDTQYQTPESKESRISGEDAQLEALSAGVTKLKLKLPSQDEWDRRQNEREEAEKKSSKALSLAATAARRKASNQSTAANVSSHVPVTASVPVTPVNDKTKDIAGGGELVVPSTAPPKTSIKLEDVHRVEALRPDDGSGSGMPGTKTEGPVAGDMHSGQQVSLPIWSATGSIPFAPSIGEKQS